jgi:methylmalonyl-CoA/ethylmalonyl-CoA epimerase
MKPNRIDHISIAVKDLDAARKVWEPLLGKTEPDDAYIDGPEKIKVARYWVGEVGFELMSQPQLMAMLPNL